MRIMVTGKHGQVVSSLLAISKSTGDEIICIGRPEIDLVNPESIYLAILEIAPDAVISAAAFTQVDKAQSESTIAYEINARAPEFIAKACKQLNIPLLHLSTDYVFSGDRDVPYLESDTPQPINEYGKSKLSGEIAIKQNCEDFAILRTSWVYSPFGNNFVKTMLGLAQTREEIPVVSDQYGCPTSALEIARALLKIATIMQKNKNSKYRGIFNLSGKDATNWADFARAIFAQSVQKIQHTIKIKDITTDMYPTLAKRPKNSRLNIKKIKETFEIEPADLMTSLKECLALIED